MRPWSGAHCFRSKFFCYLLCVLKHYGSWTPYICLAYSLLWAHWMYYSFRFCTCRLKYIGKVDSVETQHLLLTTSAATSSRKRLHQNAVELSMTRICTRMSLSCSSRVLYALRPIGKYHMADLGEPIMAHTLRFWWHLTTGVLPRIRFTGNTVQWLT